MFTFAQIIILLLIMAVYTMAVFLFAYFAGRNSRDELEIPSPAEWYEELPKFHMPTPEKRKPPDEHDPNGQPLNPIWQ